MYSKLQDGGFMIAGYVARDAETKTSQNGKTYTKWSVSVGKRQIANDKSESIWTDCIAWHDIARVAAAIKKGDTVFCIGKVEQREHEGKTYKTLNCEYISIMGKGTAVVQQQSAAPVTANTSGMAYSDFEEILSGDDSVPF